MTVGGALAGGFVGTLVLTTGLRAASEAGLTRMDMSFLLGSAFSDDRTRAKAIGWALQFALGQAFAIMYWAVFLAIDHSGWLLGAAFGLLHGLFSSTVLVNVLLPVVNPRMGSPWTTCAETPLLEPPGFLMLNYGRGTPVVNVALHLAYGTIVGGFASLGA